MLTGLIFGSIPALNGSLSVSPALRESGRVTQSRQGIRNALIVVQVAASFMLLIGAGLTIRSLIKLQQVDPGFRTDNILTMRIDLNFSKYRGQRASEFWQRVEERLKAVPNVITAGGGGTFPLNDGGSFSQPIQIRGRELPRTAGRSQVDFLFAITAAGIAGVIAFSVNQRTQEFGIRMALGAQRGSVLNMVLRQGLKLVLAGLAIGLAGALVLTRVLTTLLFGIEPTDGLTFVAVSMVLVTVAASACFVPARRAASVDPMVALRVG